MRMQILELPGVQVGDAYETPFAIIVDTVDSDCIRDQGGAAIRTVTHISDVALENLKIATGAKAVFVSSEPVEIVR